jgi:hypothetical protein
VHADAHTDVTNDNRPKVIGDGKGNWVIAWARSQPAVQGSVPTTINYVVSHNDGFTWSAPAEFLDVDGSYVFLAADETAISAIGLTNLTPEEQYHFRSTDGGASWQEVALPFESGENYKGIVAGENGEWFAATWRYRHGLSLRRSTDHGLTWGAPSTFFESAGQFEVEAIATDGAGTVVVAYVVGTEVAPSTFDYRDLYFIRTTNSGATWSGPVLMDTAVNYITGVSIDTDTRGKWSAAWLSVAYSPFQRTVRQSWSDDNATSWTAAADFLEGTQYHPFQGDEPQVATNHIGDWRVLFPMQGEPEPIHGSDQDMFAAHMSWGVVEVTPMRITNPRNMACIAGNHVLVRAEPIGDYSGPHPEVEFLYRAKPDQPWNTIPSANINSPNPDSEPPYLTHWDVSMLEETSYNLIARSSFAGFQSEVTPDITVHVSENCGSVSWRTDSETHVQSRLTSTSLVQESIGMVELLLTVFVPGDETVDGKLFSATSRPAGEGTQPHPDMHISNGQEVDLRIVDPARSSHDGRFVVVFEYPDANQDGLLDNNGMPETQLIIVRSESGHWTRVPGSYIDTQKNQVYLYNVPEGTYSLAHTALPATGSGFVTE